jgi:hypothetical protein
MGKSNPILAIMLFVLGILCIIGGIYAGNYQSIYDMAKGIYPYRDVTIIGFIVGFIFVAGAIIESSNMGKKKIAVISIIAIVLIIVAAWYYLRATSW